MATKKKRDLFIIVIIKKIIIRIKNVISDNKYFVWYIKTPKRNRVLKKNLERYYNNVKDNQDYSKAVICMYEGANAGGLADRLKGIIGVYYIAKKRGLPFRIYFNDPFPLDKYLVPNTYDWRISEKDICRDLSSISLVLLANAQDSKYVTNKQRKYLEKKIRIEKKQTHVYTSSSYAYDVNYAELFGELFKPSVKLQESIDRNMKNLNGNYVSISCRFLNLLRDFNETLETGIYLTEEEREDLFQRIAHVIENIHKKNYGKKILINSDSVTFLKAFDKLDFTYVIPGNVTHIDAKQEEYSYEKYEKTFLDFLMIANADEIYLIKSKEMYKSGYPYAASKIYDKKFNLIEI